MLETSRKEGIDGGAIVNDLTNKLPFELHLPSYQYCGPGTKLEERLRRGDPGKNPLDVACKEHDIAYKDNKSVHDRLKADKILQTRAWERVKSKDATFGERTAALSVAGVMKAKRKMGLGIVKTKRIRKQHKKVGSGVKKEKKRKRATPFKQALKQIKKLCKDKEGCGIKEVIKNALGIARRVIKTIGKKSLTLPRVIPIPKEGGFLPFLIPLFAGLSAAGAIAGGASGIAKAVNDAKEAKKQLEESTRHNRAMEAIALGNEGSGLYIKPYKTGSGLFLNPYKKGGSFYLKPYSKKRIRLPKRSLTDVDLLRYAKDVPHFRGVFMLDDLPPWQNESGIINLDER